MHAGWAAYRRRIDPRPHAGLDAHGGRARGTLLPIGQIVADGLRLLLVQTDRGIDRDCTARFGRGPLG